MLALVTLLIVIGGIIIVLFSRSIGNSISSLYTDMSDNWYEVNEEGIQDTPISRLIEIDPNSSKQVCVKLPKDFFVKGRSCIAFNTYACALDVFADGNVIYSYGKDRLSTNKMIPRHYHYICIPEDIVNSNIIFTIYTNNDTGSVLVENSYLGEIDTLARVFTLKRGYAFIICAFFITFGMLLITLAFLTGISNLQIAFPTIAQALLLINLGTYISSYNDTLLYVLRNDVLSTFVEYFSLFSLPFFMQVVIISNRKNHVNRFHLAITALDLFFIILALILHLTDTMHLMTSSAYIRSWMFIHGIYTILWLRQIYITERKNTRSYLYADAAMETIDYGLISLLLMSLFNLFLWSRDIYHLGFLNTDVKGNFIILGASVFAGCVILAYLYHSLGAAHEREIKSSLTEAAYTDELTGLNNRAYCDMHLSNSSQKDWHGSLIFLDLDGLKQINDNIGHEAGDKYILSFAHILRDNLDEDIHVCRMGGDEFLVILEGYDSTSCQSVCDRISAATEEFNSANREMPVFYSEGHASSDSEGTTDPVELFRLADQRMYVMKDEHHRMGKGGRA